MGVCYAASFPSCRRRRSGYQRSKGSGASRDFGPAKTSWRIEDPQSAKQKCLISSRFPSLTRVPLSASAAECRLLSADAPEPYAAIPAIDNNTFCSVARPQGWFGNTPAWTPGPLTTSPIGGSISVNGWWPIRLYSHLLTRSDVQIDPVVTRSSVISDTIWRKRHIASLASRFWRTGEERPASVTPSRRTPSMLAISSWVMSIRWKTDGRETAAASGTTAGLPSDAECPLLSAPSA